MEALIAAAVVLLALTVLVSALAGAAKLATVVKARREREATTPPSMDLAGAET
jgi:hypothetical protein